MLIPKALNIKCGKSHKIIYKFFDEKSTGTLMKSPLTQEEELIMKNQQLVDELHKPIIRKFKKSKVYSSFKDDIWGEDVVHLCIKYAGIRILTDPYSPV